MPLLNEGRNEIRFNNSNGQCLMENWVEERAVSHLEPEVKDHSMVKTGHRGILTTDFDAPAEKLTTVTDSYRKPQPSGIRSVGKKHETLVKMLYDTVSQEVHDEFNAPPEEGEMKSVTHKDFHKDFTPIIQENTKVHDFVSDQPVSFWSEHKDRATGLTQVKTGDTPFRRNAAFSKPIDEYWDETQPYNIENYPKM